LKIPVISLAATINPSQFKQPFCGMLCLSLLENRSHLIISKNWYMNTTCYHSAFLILHSCHLFFYFIQIQLLINFILFIVVIIYNIFIRIAFSNLLLPLYILFSYFPLHSKAVWTRSLSTNKTAHCTFIVMLFVKCILFL
jgi:hypothetical protein